MLTRKDFIRTCATAICATGLCTAVETSAAQTTGTPLQSCDPAELSNEKSRRDAAQLRFARLIETLEQRLPAEDRRQVLHVLGGKCADTYRATLIDRYLGDIRGFLDEGLRHWMAEADYNETAGTIRVVDKGPSCSCPMVKVGETPASFCDCTLGWQEATYSTILGRPVKAELEESILRGNRRCVYRMTIL